MLIITVPTRQISRPTHVGIDKCNVGGRTFGVGGDFSDAGQHFIDVGAVF